MKYALIALAFILLAVGIYVFTSAKKDLASQSKQTPSSASSSNFDSIPKETIIASGLDTPWSIAFLPNGNMLITERPGRVRLIRNNELLPQPVATLSQVREIGEGGLLGITLHPNFEKNNFVYLYYTYNSAGDNTFNRVVRMIYKDGILTNEEIIVDAIPGATNHNGGRIAFGPDNYLYITTGDAQEPSLAQDKNSLAGKILRVTDTGEIAPGNPFNNRTYSYGHRNSQGITWDSEGNMWATEHGRSGVQSGLDELNLIEKGVNYGWPQIQGDEAKQGMETAKANSGSTTWAPAGITFLNNSLYFSGLRGRSIYLAPISGTLVTEIKQTVNGEYGRIREVLKGPDNMLYISTSNRDGRGIPSSDDDKIIRFNPLLIAP